MKLKDILVSIPLVFTGCWGGQSAFDSYHKTVFTDLSPSDQAPAPLDIEGLKSAQTLSLADCFKLALVNSETLRIGGERLLQADTRIYEAISTLLPKPVAKYRYTRDSNPITFGGSTFSSKERGEYWFTISQTLWDARAIAAWDLAKETRSIEELKLKTEREDLIFTVAAIFYEVLSIEKDVETLDALLKSTEEHLRILKVREQVGEVTHQQVLLGQAQHDEAEARLIQTHHDVQRARSRLSELTGLNCAEVKLIDTYDVDWTPGEIPQLVDKALKERLELAIARQSVEQAKSEKNSVIAEYSPRATAEFSDWTHMEGGFQRLIDWTLTLNIDLTLFDGGGRESRLARALSIIRQRELEVKALEKRVRTEVEDAVIAFRSLDNAMKAFESRADAANSAVELVEREFRAGEATNLDVLVAQQMREDAVRNLERVKLARKLAVLKIRLAIGDLRLATPVQDILK